MEESSYVTQGGKQRAQLERKSSRYQGMDRNATAMGLNL